MPRVPTRNWKQQRQRTKVYQRWERWAILSPLYTKCSITVSHALPCRRRLYNSRLVQNLRNFPKMGNKVCHVTCHDFFTLRAEVSHDNQELHVGVSHDFCSVIMILILQNFRHLRLDVWWLLRRTWWACDYRVTCITRSCDHLNNHVTGGAEWTRDQACQESGIHSQVHSRCSQRTLTPGYTTHITDLSTVHVYSFVSNLCRIN